MMISFLVSFWGWSVCWGVVRVMGGSFRGWGSEILTLRLNSRIPPANIQRTYSSKWCLNSASNKLHLGARFAKSYLFSAGIAGIVTFRQVFSAFKRDIGKTGFTRVRRKFSRFRKCRSSSIYLFLPASSLISISTLLNWFTHCGSGVSVSGGGTSVSSFR